MLKIAIGCIFHNNHDELKRLVESIPKDAIYHFIAVDGVFRFTKEKNPSLPDLSNDGSFDLLFEHAHDQEKFTLIYIQKTNATEFEKRNAYLETCEKMKVDVLIVVDTDEWFVYNEGTSPEDSWTTFKKNLEFEIRRYPGHNVFGIPTWDVATNTHSYCPRIWVDPYEMRYLNNSHYHYGNIIREAKEIEHFKQNNLNFIQQAQAIVKGITLAHDHNLRSKEYQQRRKDYQRYLVKFEELVQSYKYNAEQAHELAKQQPKTDFEPT